MSKIEALKKELARVRSQNRELKKLFQQFTLADKAQKIVDGNICSKEEFDEFGIRLDGERSSRYVFDESDLELEKVLEEMKPIDRKDTENIEIMLRRYSKEEVLSALFFYDLQGFSITE